MGNSGWLTEPLSEISEIIGGGTPRTNNIAYWNGDIVWLSPTDLPPIGEIVDVTNSKSKITQFGLEQSSARLLPRGSVVFSSRATIGKIGIAAVDLCTNQGFTNFICGNRLYNKFLAYALRKYTPKISALSNSTTFAEVSKSRLKDFPIPVPPLPEQYRIVAKLDRLFERIDKAIALVEQNITNAQHLMASVLNDVFEGLDCEQKRIAETVIKTRQINPKANPESQFTYIDISSVDNKIHKITNPNSFLGRNAPSRARKEITQGDLLFATTRPNLKNIAIISETYSNQVASTGFCVLRADRTKIDIGYLFHFLVCNKTQEQIAPFIRGAQYPAISDNDLLNCIIPLPSLSEQKRITKFLTSIFKSQESLINRYTERQKALQSLKSSLLDSAFKGEL